MSPPWPERDIEIVPGVPSLAVPAQPLLLSVLDKEEEDPHKEAEALDKLYHRKTSFYTSRYAGGPLSPPSVTSLQTTSG